MRSRPALYPISDAPVPGDVVLAAQVEPADPPTGDGVGLGGDLTVYVDTDLRLPVVSVVGALEGHGQALLSAVLDHVREQIGPPIVVDLHGVSRTDRHALAPVLTADVVLTDTSPAVDEVLLDLARGSRTAAGRVRRPPRASAGTRRGTLPTPRPHRS